MKETDQLRTLMETFSDSRVRNLPGANRYGSVQGSTTPISPEEKKAKRDAWAKKGREKTKAHGGKSEFDRATEEVTEARNIPPLDHAIRLGGYVIKDTKRVLDVLRDSVTPELQQLIDEHMAELHEYVKAFAGIKK